MFLKDVDSSFLAENEEFECKARLERNHVLGWLKNVDGFANAKGGYLYIGVEDKSYTLIGFDEAGIDKERLYFYHEIEEHLPVLPSLKAETIPYVIKGQTRYLLKIQIFESREKPLLLKYQGMPMTFVRRDGFTNAASMEEIRKMALQNQTPNYDTQETDVPYHRKNFTILQRFAKERIGRELSDKELSAIGFFNSNGLLRKGALLFADDCQSKNTEVVCSLYRGQTKGDNYILASNPFSGNLIDAYQFIDQFVQARMNHGFLKTADSRIDIDSFPSRALFEGIINALAHRDYLLDNTQISIDLFRNRLSISSPGSLYDGNDIKPTYQLSALSSRRRNPLICSVFVALKAMEAKGTGFEKIEDDYKAADERHQPYVFSKNNQFVLVLPDMTYSEGLPLNKADLRIIGAFENPSRYDADILAYCYFEKRSSRQIAEELQVSDSSYLRDLLKNLTNQGYLISSKEGKTTYYLVNRLKVSKN